MFGNILYFKVITMKTLFLQLVFSVTGLFLFYPSSSAELTANVNKLIPDVFHYDHFDKCLSDANDPVFCFLTLHLGPVNSSAPNDLWQTIKRISSDERNYRRDILRHGICVPEGRQLSHSTLYRNLGNYYSEKYEKHGLSTEIVKLRCENRDSEYEVGSGDLIFGFLVSVYMGMVIFISVYLKYQELTSKKNYDRILKTSTGQILTLFSVFENWRLLIYTDPKKQNVNFIPGMQGIRLVACLLVMMMHIPMGYFGIPTSNPSFIEETMGKIESMLMHKGGVMVQAYFVLSAWLLTSHFINKLKKEKITLGYIFRYIFSRYLRLAPVLMLIIIIHNTWLVHWSRGPLWDDIIGEDRRICQHNWWKNLFFIHNYLIEGGECLLPLWSLAADLQLLVLGALIFWFFQKKPQRIAPISLMIIVFYFLYVILTFYFKNWKYMARSMPEQVKFFQSQYDKQWIFRWILTFANLPGFVVGIFFGFIYEKFKNEHVFNKTIHVIIAHMMFWSLFLGPIVITSYYAISEFYTRRDIFDAFIEALCKLLFASGLGLGIFAMSQGLGGFLKNFFEHCYCHILAQLSFCAYLVHFSVLRVRLALLETLPHLSYTLLFYEYFVVIVVSFVLSLVLTLAVQIPVTIFSLLIVKNNKTFIALRK